MKTTLSVIILLFCLGVAGNGYASDSSFSCKITHQYQLETDGKLVEPDILTFRPDSSFEVERATGKIVGARIGNQGNYQITVVDSEAAGSYKVFSIAPDASISKSLIITTGQNKNGRMPFVFFGLLNEVVTGTCE